MADAIDKKAIKNLLDSIDHDREFFLELVEIYLAESPAMINSMRQAARDGDVQTFHRTAHTLKSNSSNFGAHTLAQISKSLEDLGRSGSLSTDEPRIIEAENELGRVREELEEIISAVSADGIENR